MRTPKANLQKTKLYTGQRGRSYAPRAPYGNYGNYGRGYSGDYQNVGAMAATAERNPVGLLGYTLGRYIGDRVDQHNDKLQGEAEGRIAANIGSMFGAKGEQNYLNAPDMASPVNLQEQSAMNVNPDMNGGVPAQGAIQPPDAKEQMKQIVGANYYNDFSDYGPNAAQAKRQEEKLLETADKMGGVNLATTPWDQVQAEIDRQVDGTKLSARRKALMKENLYKRFQGQADKQADQMAFQTYLGYLTKSPEEYQKEAVPLATQLYQAGKTKAAQMLLNPIFKRVAADEADRRALNRAREQAYLKADLVNQGVISRGGRPSSGGTRATSGKAATANARQYNGIASGNLDWDGTVDDGLFEAACKMLEKGEKANIDAETKEKIPFDKWSDRDKLRYGRAKQIVDTYINNAKNRANNYTTVGSHKAGESDDDVVSVMQQMGYDPNSPDDINEMLQMENGIDEDMANELLRKIHEY